MYDLDLLYSKKNFASLCESIIFKEKDVFNVDALEYLEKEGGTEFERYKGIYGPIIAQTFLNLGKEEADDENKLKFEIMIYLAGCNEESKVDKDMIQNVIVDNQIQYGRQLNANERPHPVIAFILNFSKDPYDGPTKLSELITNDFIKNLDKELQPMDWKVNVIDMASFRDNDFNNFSGDIKIALKLWDMIINEKSAQIKDYTKGLEVESWIALKRFVSKITDYKVDVQSLFNNEEKPYYQVYAEQYIAKILSEKDSELSQQEKLLVEKVKKIEAMDKEIKEQDKQIENSVIAILEDATVNDEKIKKIFNITEERLAEIKAKIKD